MSAKCVVCAVKEDREATPVRAALLVLALAQTHSVEEMVGHLCKQHRRTVDDGVYGSLVTLRKLMAN